MIINSTLVLFQVLALGFTLILAFIVIFPWLRRANYLSKHQTNFVHLNVSIFRERLTELEADHQKSALETSEYLEHRTDLERQLLAAHSTNTADSHVLDRFAPSTARVSRLMVLMVFLSIPILVFSAYYSWSQYRQSDHQALLNFWNTQDQYANVAEALITGKMDQPPADVASHAGELLQAMQVNASQHPFDAKRWLNLSQTYMEANAVEPALATLAHAYRLEPENTDIAMTYAQMRFFSLQGKMDAVTQGIVSRILDQNPQHEGALLLMSMATYREQHYDEAINWLQRLKRARLARATLSQPVDPAIIAQLDQTIRDAEVAKIKLAQAADHTVAIDLQVADVLKSKLRASDTLFVYVRALQGSQAPYAVQKIPVLALLDAVTHHQALAIKLSDANSMLPTRTISSAQVAGTPLVAVARVSQHDNPMGEAGDLESLPVPIDLDSAHEQRYVVNIDQIRP